jgi:hypothetical protein
MAQETQVFITILLSEAGSSDPAEIEVYAIGTHDLTGSEAQAIYKAAQHEKYSNKIWNTGDIAEICRGKLKEFGYKPLDLKRHEIDF